jgi:oligoendopeptidase F
MNSTTPLPSLKNSSSMSKKVPTATKAPLTAKALLEKLNRDYRAIHTKYERLYWQSHMGDHSVNDAFAKAQIAREHFRTDEVLAQAVTEALTTAKGTERTKLEQWALFFSKFQTPAHVKELFSRIVTLEKEILTTLSTRTEGYIEPGTKKFIEASRAQMSSIMHTHTDEKVRKACFVALEELALTCTKELVQLVGLKNEYARALGYEDFYAYKIMIEENMTKQELFSIFDTIYEKTAYAFADIRKMEEDLPGLRKPWNRAFLLSGSFTKEADKYFPFERALERWGRSFAALGINFQGGTLQLDLLARAGKYENGFCHWPELVYFEGKKRIPGAANFTCNVAYGQIGSSHRGYNTLFHEGGHAAHLLNTEETEVCVNNEYPPASTAWDETQSMFLDTMLGSIEWNMRYAQSNDGEPYPFSLYEREVKRLRPLAPLRMNGITAVMSFERAMYEEKNLTETKLIAIAKRINNKYTDSSADTVRLLSVPHIYSWESSCSYQGYGLAEIALYQWREYFFKKYGYIVDNPQVGKEMKAMWKYGSAKPFPECVLLATGKKLSPSAYLKQVTLSAPAKLKRAKERVALLTTTKPYTKPIDLKATIKLVHGKKTIATNKKSFEDMAQTYAAWLATQRVTNR